MRRFNTLTILLVLFGFGCDQAKTGNTKTTQQAVGESSRPIIFSGPGTGLMPNYDERVLHTFMNGVRMHADDFNLVDGDGIPVDPQPPAQWSQSMAETGRWQGKQQLENRCVCPFVMADSGPASCCEVGVIDGVAQCLGPIGECSDAEATPAPDRWTLLKNGPGTPSFEFTTASADPADASFTAAVGVVQQQIVAFSRANVTAIAFTRADVPVPPADCLAGDDACGEGDCQDPNSGESTCTPGNDDNPDCIGFCLGGPSDGDACIIPGSIPEDCQPEFYPLNYHWSYIGGRTLEPTPPITDGIHYAVQDQAMNVLLRFQSSMFDPQGAPNSFELVVNGTCTPMDPQFAFGDAPGDVGGDAGDAGVVDAGGPEFPPHGASMIADIPIGTYQPGCYRYYFAMENSEGVIETYPTLGSLGAVVDATGGFALEETDTCPIWSNERPAAACLAAGNQCSNGESRLCYSGREGTQGKGACAVGTESCSNGRWDGVCAGEVLPEIDEVCDDMVDNNCNGFVDESCAREGDDVGGFGDGGGGTPDVSVPDVGTPDMGVSEPDMGPIDVKPPANDDEGCCTTINSSKEASPFWLLLLGLFVAIRRRRASVGRSER